MKFSKYTSKAVTFRSWPYFKSSNNCLSNKATTICGHSAVILRSVPVRLNRRGVFTEISVRFAPPTMCRLTPIEPLLNSRKESDAVSLSAYLFMNQEIAVCFEIRTFLFVVCICAFIKLCINANIAVIPICPISVFFIPI